MQRLATRFGKGYTVTRPLQKMRTGQKWDNEAAIAKFAAQFSLSEDDVKTIKELEKEQDSTLQEQGKKWFFKPFSLTT